MTSPETTDPEVLAAAREAVAKMPRNNGDMADLIRQGRGTLDHLSDVRVGVAAINEYRRGAWVRFADIAAALRAPEGMDYAEIVEPYAAAIRMIRDAVGELFGPQADLESDDAVLLRGPEPHHDADAIIAALQRLSSWRTMDNVPKGDGSHDGPRILVYGGKVTFDLSENEFDNKEVECVHWSASEQCWIIGNNEGHREYIRLQNPAGWQPFPASPLFPSNGGK